MRASAFRQKCSLMLHGAIETSHLRISDLYTMNPTSAALYFADIIDRDFGCAIRRVPVKVAKNTHQHAPRLTDHLRTQHSIESVSQSESDQPVHPTSASTNRASMVLYFRSRTSPSNTSHSEILIASGCHSSIADQTLKGGSSSLANLETVTEIQEQHQVTAACFSPDGEQWACARADGIIDLWDTKTLIKKSTLHCNSFPINKVAFSPDSKKIALLCTDDTINKQISLLRIYTTLNS